MRKPDFDHVVAAAADLTGETEIVVIGSQAMGWEDRLVRVEVPRRPGRDGSVVALCMEVHDLILAKCGAGRDRDWAFAEIAMRAEIVELPRLLSAVEEMPFDSPRRRRMRTMLEGIGTRLPAS